MQSVCISVHGCIQSTVYAFTYFTHEYHFSHRLTASQSFELGCTVGTVPSIPGKLVFALLNPSLSAHLHAPSVGEIGLQERQCLIFNIWGPDSHFKTFNFSGLIQSIKCFLFTLGPVMRKLLAILRIR